MDDKDNIILTGEDEITIDIGSDSITLDSNSIDSNNYFYTSPYITTGAVGASYGNITINTAAGSNGTWGSLSNTMMSSSSAGLHVTSNAEFDGDVKIKGVSINKTLEDIQKRLAILVPDPAKLEHFESLKKAYEHYKTLEALCELPTKEEEN